MAIRARPVLVCFTATLVFALSALAGCAGRMPSKQDMAAANAAEASALIQEGSPGALATASMLSRPFSQNTRAGDLLARAIALAPDRPELIWLQLRECADTDCASEKQAANRLKAVDPGNGFAWLPDLTAAEDRHSEADVTAAIAQIGASPYLRIYFNPLTVMAYDAFCAGSKSKTRTLFDQDDNTCLLNAVGLVVALVIPPFQGMGKACKAEQLKIPRRRQGCEALVVQLEKSDTVIAEVEALSLQRRWWPADSPQGKAVLAKRRQLDYLISASSRERPVHANRDARMRIQAARHFEREQDVARVMLARYHEPLDPPANWQDPWPR